MSHWDGTERRSSTGDRRCGQDRRTHTERRRDHRLATAGGGRSLRRLLRTWIRPRLGVDRRKGGDRRVMPDRRGTPSAILSAEEIAALLGEE